MANEDNFDVIINFIEKNSQNTTTADDPAEDESEAKKTEEKYKKRRIQTLRDLGKTEDEIQQQLIEDEKEIEEDRLKKEQKTRLEQLKEAAEYGATLQERLDAEHEARQLETANKVATSMATAVTSSLSSLYDKIEASFSQYADYVERLEVNLQGSQKSYDSVTNTLEKVFSMNVFFSLDDAINKATEMVEKGINYNVELRASLDVMSEKIVSTFDALDETLTRLVKIQQQDSTEARLGMESLLQTYLNASFQDSEYLHTVSDQVSAYLLEAESLMGRDEATEFEYAVQKWLGSFSSVGVSDSTILALAQGIGYLASGDVDALTSNDSLQQLLAMSIAYSGSSTSYGEMLLNGMTVEDVSSVMTGFFNLINQVYSTSDNLVALNQYADIFNLSVSDLASVLNLTANDIELISQDMASYNDMISEVENQLSTSNLKSRTSYSQMVENIQANTLTAIGLDAADNLSLAMSYAVSDIAADIIDMINLGIDIDPFGIGVSTKINGGDMLKAVQASITYGAEWAKNKSAFNSLTSPDLSALNGEESTGRNSITIYGGLGTSSTTSGQTTNTLSYVGNSDSSAAYEMMNDYGKSTSSQITNMDIDEEQAKSEAMMDAVISMGDGMDVLIQLMDTKGIVVRAYLGGSEAGAPGITSSEDTDTLVGGY